MQRTKRIQTNCIKNYYEEENKTRKMTEILEKKKRGIIQEVREEIQ